MSDSVMDDHHWLSSMGSPKRVSHGVQSPHDLPHSDRSN